jgi:hypothetical protein
MVSLPEDELVVGPLPFWFHTGQAAGEADLKSLRHIYQKMPRDRDRKKNLDLHPRKPGS